MLGKKRGQVTVFVALGIILVAVLVIAIAFRGEISKIVTESESETQTDFEARTNEVQIHIERCLDNALEQSIGILANKKLKDYDTALEEDVTLRFSLCLNFESFTDLQIKKLTEPEVEIQRSTDNLLITATLNMQVSMQSGSDEKILEEFVSQQKLQRRMCVLEEKLNDNCRAKEDLVVGIFNFKQGQEVKIGGECLAC